MSTLSIRHKLTLLIGGLVVVIVVVLNMIATYRQETQLVTSHNRLGLAMVEVVAEQVKPFIVINDLRSIYKTFTNTLTFENVDYLILLDIDGKVVMHNNLDEIGKMYNDHESRVYFAVNEPIVKEHPEYIVNKHIHEIIKPLDVGTIRLGTILLGYSHAEVDAEVNATRRQNLVFGIIAIICGLALANILATFLVRPLKKLTAATEKLGRGHLDAEVDIERGDELGDLARAFNTMTSDLQRTTVSRDFVNNILNNTGQGLVVINRDCTMRLANAIFAKILGYARETLPGQKCHDILSHGLCGTEGCVLKRILAGESIAELETVVKCKDGRLIYIRVVATPLIEDGEVTGIIESIQDISDRVHSDREKQELQKQLMQAQKMESIGRLAGGVAHDFNNILMVIISYSELALMGMDDEDPRKDNISEIFKAANRAASLTSQLLTLSRKQVMKKEVLNLNEVIGQMMKMFRRMIGGDIYLDVDAEQLGNTIRADRCQIEQILMNLAVNARDAMPAGGTLRIRLCRAILTPDQLLSESDTLSNPYVLLRVEDTGVGMSTELKDQVFEPFFTTKTRDKGTGLGLSTVYGIVKQHDGHIFVDSLEGQGTTFRLYFPLVVDVDEVVEETADSPIKNGQETVLVVDDEPAIREIISMTLEPYGYNVLTAECGEKALEIAAGRKERIDLVITDIMMPGMNGWELAAELRDADLVDKIIFLSGYDFNPEQAHKFQVVEKVYLQKPLAPKRVLAEVRSVLDYGTEKN